MSHRTLWWKRPLDLALVLVSAPIWLPLCLCVAILVRLVLGSPVLYRQIRPGRFGRPFTLLKFRTMTDAHGPSGAPLSDAERLTAFGSWLRSTSLDELPELLNVIRGEMTLVGPRPLLMEYLGHYTGTQARRHEVTPGLTGWAQVNGRNSLDWESRFELDVWYVDHAGLCLDVRILTRTLLCVLLRRGISANGEATMPKFTGTKDT